MSIAYEPGGTVAQLARAHLDPKAVFASFAISPMRLIMRIDKA